MTFTLRPMTEEDLPAVVAIENSWSYLSKWGIPGFRSALRNASTFACLVAEVQAETPTGKILSSHKPNNQKANIPNAVPPPHGFTAVTGLGGFAVLGRMLDHAELCDIVILPDHLGSGLGQLLLDHCLQIVISNQLPALFLEVRQSNMRAIRFYEKNGFSIISSRKRYYQNPLEDAWVMKKVIPLH
jgi:ribosomal protein S18 acetylase RimI-like enzyme